MNKIEKTVYDGLKKFPFIKSFIRNFYQYLTLSVRPPKQKLKIEYEIIVKEGYFFDFHDKIPWSHDNTKLLAHKIKDPDSGICDGEIEIGYFDEDVNDFKVLATTTSWNWQQGSMLQWRSANEIIYNCWNGERNIARLIDDKGSFVKELHRPISSISKCGRYCLSFSFTRLGIGMEGYGYLNVGQAFDSSNLEPDYTGIHLYEFTKNSFEMLFSVKDIADFKRLDSMAGSYHYLAHTQLSNDGHHFLFLHRWQERKTKRVSTRLLTYDLEQRRLFLYETSGMVSHLTWYGKGKILAYAATSQFGDAYTIFEVNSDKVEILDKEIFNSDGHPQFCEKNNLVVSDTYPNRSRIQKLFLIDLKTELKTELGSFYSPLKHKEIYRCDLHPRWDRLGSRVCVDSVHTGKRAICILDLMQKTVNPEDIVS